MTIVYEQTLKTKVLQDWTEPTNLHKLVLMDQDQLRLLNLLGSLV